MNGVPPSAPERAYINVMESLVAQEVGQQFQAVPARIRRYLRMEEVVTYALNRLPALYASSEKGWQCQRQLAKRDLHRQIKDAVRQAIMAVQVDPLRLSQPLQVSHNEEAEAVLQALR
ncbi:MAG TPA: late competence development ComFB family protein, partial [Candidatus Obscuribacterales bacterium]